MLTTIIKFSFIYFFCLFISQKSLVMPKFSFSMAGSISVILSIITYLISLVSKGASYIFPLLLLWILTSILNFHPQISFVAITVSYVISFIMHTTLGFIFAFLITPFFESSNHYLILSIISGIFQALVTKKLFSIKRLQNGIPFLSSGTHINSTTILCLTFICFIIYMTSHYTSVTAQASALFLFVLALAFLIYWWQAQITKSYRRSLELRELESLRTEVAELNLKIQKLSEDNEKLARITHRDNTLITTLKNSTVKYLSTDFKNPAEAIAARDKLISNINALSAGRTSLPANYNERTPREFHTDISLLDELLHHMDETAIERKIEFAVHFGTELADFVPKDISESDLVHTVDDLLKNAFKATTTCEKRVVQLQFYKLGKHFVIEVADSGIPFEVESLVNMGIEKRTTYVDGSGIGLMDIWSTKNKYGATYHLEEYSVAAPFSKKISLTLDKKNRYSIRTWRKNEILALCRRADLQVYDHSE